MPNFTELPPLTLYIHFPWCVQKCPYCDFNSHAQQEPVPETEYISALLSDLENDLPLVWGRKITSIFMGGGTPSLFSPDAIENLLNGIRARIPLSPFAEITLEANPGTLDNQKLPGFKQAGVNRVSIGVQSFNDQHLKTLGRIHNADKAAEAIELAKKHFEHVNLDLMFGLPEQTLQEAEKDLETAIALDTDHLSYYELTLEPNTAFFQNPPTLPDDELAWEIFQQGLHKLDTNGFGRYEISAYAKKGNQCRHNLNYWQFGDYLGIGAGAHAKITDANQQNVTRYTKKRHPRDYLASSATHSSFISSTQILDQAHLKFDFLLNAFRLINGFKFSDYEKRTGLDAEILLAELKDKMDLGLLDFDNKQKHIKASEKGIHFLNDILETFLP